MIFINIHFFLFFFYHQYLININMNALKEKSACNNDIKKDEIGIGGWG